MNRHIKEQCNIRKKTDKENDVTGVPNIGIIKHTV